MPKITSYGGFTPILTDLLYGVDNPGGTPISDKMTIAALLALLDASSSTLTNKELGAGCSVSDPLETFESTGIDDNATSHALTIDSSQRILTGVVVPDVVGANAGSMTISTGNSGVTTAHTAADDLIIERNSLVGITIATPNTATGSIYFADPESNSDGRIVYSHADGSMELWTGGQRGLRIDSTNRIITGVFSNNVDALGAASGSMTINTTDSGVTAINGQADELILEANGNCGMTIASPNNSIGAIYFADTEDDNVGQIKYAHAANDLQFITGGGATSRITLNANTGTTAGTGSAGAGNQTVELTINGLRYNLLHDGTT